LRSTPARLLHPDQLVVERFGVHKIRQVEHAIPHNTVTVRMTHQMTGNWATRNLRWDEQVTTEEPLEIKIGETGKIRIELALLANEEDPPVYRYKIIDERAGIDYEAIDLRLGVGDKADNKEAAETLIGLLIAGAEAHDAELDGRRSVNEGLFPHDISEWAYEHGVELVNAAIDLGGGLEAGR
jgi:hypothetical protein